MIRNGVVIDFRHVAFLGAQNASKVTEVVNRQRDVSVYGFADRLTVVPGFSRCQLVQVFFETVCDFQQDVRTLCGRSFAPCVFCSMCCVECELDVCCVGAGNLTYHFTGDRGDVVKVFAGNWGNPFAADKVVVAIFEWVNEIVDDLGHLVHVISPPKNRVCRGMQKR